MKNFKVSATVLTIIVIFQIKGVVEALNLKFITATGNYSSNYFTNLTIYTHNSSLYFEADLIRPLVSVIKVSLEFQIRLANSKNYQSLFSYNFDICTMSFVNKDTLYKKWFKSLQKYGNFLQNCPIYAGRYYLQGWRMESSLVPKYLFPADYRLKGHIYAGKTKDFIANVTIEVTVVDK